MNSKRVIVKEAEEVGGAASIKQVAMMPTLRPYVQNTAILAYSVNNKKYERHIKKVLDRVNQDKNIISVHVCLACTLQAWNKIIEGYSYEEALSLAKSNGDIIEPELDKQAKNILGNKYKGIIRWYSCADNKDYLNERDKFGVVCVKSTVLRILHDLVKSSSRESLLGNESNISGIFEGLLQGKKWGEIPWETAMAASIFDYAINFLKKNNPKKNPKVYDNKSFTDVLDTIFCNCYEYLAEEAVIAYNFWDYNKLLYFGKITPILSKAYEEFILKRGFQNKLWWQEIELVADINIDAAVENHINSYLKNQKVQVKKEQLLAFTNSATSLLKLINEATSKDIRCLLKLLATSLIVANGQITSNDD